MAVECKGFTAISGGGAGALDAEPNANIDDGDPAIVFVEGAGVYSYVADTASGAAESLPNVVAPDDVGGGNLRWLLQTADVVGASYFPDHNEADQGVAGNGRSANTYIDAINTDSATLVFQHNSGGATTTYTFSTNETIPSNIACKIEPGAILSIDNGVTLTINGPLEAGLHQIVSGAGAVSFGAGAVKEVYPEWWGIDGTADEAQINLAITSISEGEVELQNTTYTIADSILMDDNVTLQGKGVSSILQAAASSDGFPFIRVNGKHGAVLRNFACDGNEDSRALTLGNGCIFIQGGAYNNLVENLVIRDFGKDDGSGNFITLEVRETDSSDTYGNTVRNCVLTDTNGKSNFGIRLWTDWTLATASDSYTRFVRDNTIENNILDGFTWNALEVAGPASVYNYIHNNLSINHSGFTGFEADKGASHNKFVGNKVRDMDAIDAALHAFRDQGDPADAPQPERFAQDNIFDNNSVEGLEQTGANGTSGFFAHRSKRCLVSNHRVTDITGANITGAAFYLQDVEDIRIEGSNVKGVQTGVYQVGGNNADGVSILGGSFNVDGLFFTAGGNGTSRSRQMIKGCTIVSGATAIQLRDEEILVMGNFITGPASDTGINGGASTAKGIFIGNIIDSFTTGISLAQDTQLAIGNVFLSCTANFVIGADLRSTVFANLGDGSASRASIIIYDTAAPVAGTFVVGDIVLNTVPAAGGTPGWVCTTAGTPGTWKAMANLAA